MLLAGLPAGTRLLVITNTSVPPLQRARQVLRDSLGDRARIACWLDVRDDRALGEALTALLGGQCPSPALAVPGEAALPAQVSQHPG